MFFYKDTFSSLLLYILIGHHVLITAIHMWRINTSQVIKKEELLGHQYKY